MEQARLVIGLIWIFVCTGVFFWLLLHDVRWFKPVRLMVVMCVAAFIRIAPAIFFRRGTSYEMHLFADIGADLLAGENVLTRLPYLPMQIYWMAFSEWLVRNVGMEFTFWFKLPSIVADVLIIWLLQRLLLHGGNSESVDKGVWLYAVNPVTILVCSYHGQFDTIPLYFLMLALTAIRIREKSGSVLGHSSGWLGLGILSKTWPGILLPSVLVRKFSLKEKFVYLMGVVIVPLVGIALSLLLFGGGTAIFFKIVRRSLDAGSIPGWWGYTAIINTLRWIAGKSPHDFLFLVPWKVFIVLPLVGVVIWFMRGKELDSSVFMALLTIFVTAPGLGIQSFCWLVPFFVIRRDWKAIAIYVALSALHMVLFYWGVHFDPKLISFAVWEDLSGIVKMSAIPVWCYCVFLWGSQLRSVVIQRSGTIA